MGLRVRLRADFDLSDFPPQTRVMLQALKTYGMMVADNGSDWYVSGAPDARWDDDDLHSLSQVKGSDFEVVDSRALLPGAFYLSLPATGSVREGSDWAASGSAYDQAGAAWTGSADYDDGLGPVTLTVGADRLLSLSHCWPDDGSRRVRVEVGNDLDRHAAASVLVTVTNVTPRPARRRERAGAPRRLVRAALLVHRPRRGHLDGHGQLRGRDRRARPAPARRQDVRAEPPLPGRARAGLHRHHPCARRRRRQRRRTLQGDGALSVPP